MKYLVVGTETNGKRFHETVFASCPREAEVFVYLKAMTENTPRSVAAVFDENRRRLHALDVTEPALLPFDEMLSELLSALLAGRVSVSACHDLKWLEDIVRSDCADPMFFTRAERLVRQSPLSSAGSDWYREAFTRLSSIGIGLLEARSIPQTQTLYDSMFQVRVTSILYGSVLDSAFRSCRLKLVKNM